MTKNEFDRIFYACPGAWYGNSPNPPYYPVGNITVDAECVIPAYKYLSRRVCIRATHASVGKGGISFDIAYKG